jgi:hypothetical protein
MGIRMGCGCRKEEGKGVICDMTRGSKMAFLFFFERFER